MTARAGVDSSTVETTRTPRISSRKRKVKDTSDFCQVYPCAHCDCVCATYDLVVEHILAHHVADNSGVEDTFGHENVAVKENRVKSREEAAVLDKLGVTFGIKKLEVKLKKLRYAIPEEVIITRPDTSRQGYIFQLEIINYLPLL